MSLQISQQEKMLWSKKKMVSYVYIPVNRPPYSPH